MKKYTPIILLICTLFSCIKKEDQSKLDVNFIALNYKSLHRMTPKPVYIDPWISTLCTSIPIADMQKIDPHGDSMVHMYMNEKAKMTLLSRDSEFPVGSVVVKDKNQLSFQTHDLNLNQGVGGMIKRKKGYDPENGDWEYFYFNTLTKIDSGKIKSCINCHQKAVNTDYVYGTWFKK